MSIKKLTKTVKLHEIFLCEYGNSLYTKAYCNQHNGNYEVFTGTTIGSFAFINHYDYSEPNLTFTTDGEKAGTLAIIKNDKYSVGGHRAILKRINNNTEIDLDYCFYSLKDKLYPKVKKGSVPSINWKLIKDIEITIPIKTDGSFDIDEQQRLVSIYSEIESKKQVLFDKIEEINSLSIHIKNENEIEYKKIALNDLFEYKRGKVISKHFINSNKGKYPVFSTQNDMFGYIDSYYV
ncbi:restriction endonuclease subunit S [Campylobacter coli]